MNYLEPQPCIVCGQPVMPSDPKQVWEEGVEHLRHLNQRIREHGGGNGAGNPDARTPPPKAVADVLRMAREGRP